MIGKTYTNAVIM